MTKPDGKQLPLGTAFVVNERTGKAYWDHSTKIEQYRTIKLTDATVIIEYDNTDPEEPEYDAKRVTVDRLTGAMRLDYLTKDASKDSKTISRGTCHKQRPLF